VNRWLLRLLLLPLRIVWSLLRGLVWLIDELSGENRRSREIEEKRKAMEERPPLTDQAFLEQLGVAPEEAPAWLAVRRVVASCGYLPETALHPDDTRADLETLFRAPPDAPWFDLGANWFEVVMSLKSELGVRIPDEELDALWVEADRAGQLQTFRQVAALLVEAIRQGQCCAPSPPTRRWPG